jgi:hypothetical protein
MDTYEDGRGELGGGLLGYVVGSGMVVDAVAEMSKDAGIKIPDSTN